MSKSTLASGTSPFAHLLNGMLGRKPNGKKADDDGIEPEDEGEIDQGEVDDALDDAGVDDVQDGSDAEPDGKQGKKAKGKKAKAGDDDSDDDDMSAEEPEDEKEAKAFRRGVTLGAARGEKRENARCKAIFSSSAAGARPDVAAQLAFGTRQSAAEAVGVLNSVATGQPAGSRLDARMADRRDPRPSADAPAPAGGGKPTLAQRIAATKKKAGIS